MTRPKVPDDKRIRTAQACDSCKRRKQKCNGLKPCNTCTKRNFVCEYMSQSGLAPQPAVGQGDTHARPLTSSPTRRRRSTPETVDSADEPAEKRPKVSGRPLVTERDQHQQQPTPQTSDLNEPSRLLGLPTPIPPPATPGQLARDPDLEIRSRQSTVSGNDEVAEVYTETRMLQDPTGRLLYLGDSATLSYLQFIRMIVESVDGPSQFTTDPSRHRLMEATTTLPPDTRPPVLLPDRKTADVLVKAYFTNTNGLIEAFERKAFTRRLDACYQDPLAAEPTFLCLLYLVFAIGLVLVTPAPGSEDENIIQKLQASHTDRAELFFRSAKCLGDPTTGFEDADFWSVQALLLMSVYMLARTKRNASYAYHGMAVRSAYALGLHRRETLVVFPVTDRVQRRNVWRSLYVLDRFLAAALGRPTSISEGDCSPDALVTPDKYLAENDTDMPSMGGLNAAVRSCQVIGIILKRIYAQRKISTRLAQDISEQCKGGPQKYNPGLHWRQAMNKPIDPAIGMAILHVNLLYCHAVILLTRPFFLFLMNRLQQEKLGTPRAMIRPGSRMEKFSEACVNAAYHTITLVQMGFEGRYLPQRDPFIIHFLFAAALVVQSNEFASLHRNPAYADTFQKAMTIMDYCAKSDPQASRLVYILTTFNHVIVSRAPGAASLRDPVTVHTPVPNTPTGALSQSSNDPIANFFLAHSNPTVPAGSGTFGVQGQSQSTSQQQQSQPAPDLARRNSANVAPGPSPSPGMMPTTAATPTASAAGDIMSDAEWFHFDSLWENWAPTPGGAATGPAGRGGGSVATAGAVVAPALFHDATLNSFEVPGAATTTTPVGTFSAPPVPGAPHAADVRFAGGGGAMQVPLYPTMRFAE